ncbi:MAG: winged helix-turn-helix domain-containing protein [Gammaproteobacteria bacterium]|nr:winged helix-turn-helix domain-containing protein [Gammaproteobacteria bacterium]
MKQTDRADTYVFSDFCLDRRTQTLCKNGERISLTPKATQLLLVLLENAPNLVSRSELHSALWSDSTFIEFEGALNACVRQVRAALGDTASRSSFIETSPKRGYRFVAELIGSQKSEGHTQHSWPTIAAVVIAIVAVLSVAQFFLGKQNNEEPQLLVVLPIESDDELAIDPMAAYGTAIIVSEYLAKLDPHKFSIINSRSVRELASLDTNAGFSRTPDLIVRARIESDSDNLVLRAKLRRSIDGSIVSEFEQRFESTMATVLRRTPALIVDWTVEALDIAGSSQLASSIDEHGADLNDQVASAFWYMESGSSQNLNEALNILNQVIVLDPNHVWAMEGKLTAMVEKSFFELNHSKKLVLHDQIESLAQEMLARDFVSSLPYQALSHVRLFRDWDLAEAENLIEAALLITPGDARAHGAHASVRAATGDTAGAVRSAELAERLDPAAMVVRSDRCWFLLFDQRYKEAADVCENSLVFKPNDGAATLGLALALYEAGEEQSALKIMWEAIRNSDLGMSKTDGAVPSSWQQLGCMRADDLIGRGKTGQVSHYQLARYLASCGRSNETLEQLAYAIEKREFPVLFVRLDGQFRFLRTHPDFESLVELLP